MKTKLLALVAATLVIMAQSAMSAVTFQQEGRYATIIINPFDTTTTISSTTVPAWLEGGTVLSTLIYYPVADTPTVTWSIVRESATMEVNSTVFSTSGNSFLSYLSPGKAVVTFANDSLTITSDNTTEGILSVVIDMGE